jgi:hypothetical protein
VKRAGDIGTFGGGVGGTGDVKALNASTPGHGSPREGMTSAGSEPREALDALESADERRELVLLFRRELCLRRRLFFRRVSSSDDTSYRSSNSVASVVKLSLVHGAEDGA